MTRGYSNEEIMAMQRDAIRRVNEMRRISEEKLRQSGNSALPAAKPPPDPLSIPPLQQEKLSATPPQGGLGDLLRLFGSDQETLLLLALLFLLIREGADIPLILALVYILL